MKTDTATLGSLIDKLNKIRDDKRAIQEKLDAKDAEYKELEEVLLGRLAAEGMDKATGKTATISVSSSISFSIKPEEDAKFFAWMARTKNFQIMQRRISDPAAREILELKRGEIPGLESFTKKRLNLRSIKASA